MAKKKVSEVNAKQDQEKMEKVQTVSSAIQAILESNNMALQPFMIRSEFGDRPSVRLVETPNQDNNVRQESNSGEAEKPKDTAGPAETTQS